MPNAYPLAWPEGWPRTPAHQKQDSRYRFARPGANGRRVWTFAAARDALGLELDRMGAKGIILSTNYELKLDGQPRGDRAAPYDTGVAIYFTLKGRPQVMACDMHLRAEENMRSLALSLEAMRALERHGGGTMMEKAFTGFTALPAPKTCWEILGLHPGASSFDVERAWKIKIARAHPDAGGSEAAAAEINAARDTALRELAR